MVVVDLELVEVGIQVHDWHAHVLDYRLENWFDRLVLVSYPGVEVSDDLEVASVDDVLELKDLYHSEDWHNLD